MLILPAFGLVRARALTSGGKLERFGAASIVYAVGTIGVIGLTV